ncbi:hypothetical protein D8B45_02820 [Candidatus Gracilibacteria bacterium]|nr:MAG: hypothetical protein D8B45_02820 [Candidatus Gracilibacteria bacterium]
MKDSRNSLFFNNTLSGALKEKKAVPLMRFSLVFGRPPLDEGGFLVVIKELGLTYPMVRTKKAGEKRN